jgi:hypothetical protein
MVEKARTKHAKDIRWILTGSARMGNGRRKCISKRRAAVTGLTLLPKSAVSSMSGNKGTESEAAGTAVNSSGS